MHKQQDYITPVSVNNLSDLFYERVKRSANKVAYTYYDETTEVWADLTWDEIARQVQLWHTAFRHEGLVKGDRVAIMMRNCPDWVIFDQAAYSLGLIVVPVYTNDRAENIRYILENANVKVFFIEDLNHCKELIENEDVFKGDRLKELVRIVTHQPVEGFSNPLLVQVKNWLPSYSETIERIKLEPDDLATVVYTSGTTGRPKGVMLSHHNIFINAHSGAIFERFDIDDVFLSFLPLSHMFERTAGYYMPMVIGAKIAYARSIDKLAEDLITIKPTVFVTVPRIFERVYNKIHDQLAKKSPVAQGLFKLAVNVGWHRFLLQQKRQSWHPKLLLWPLLNKLVAGKILAKLGGNLQLAVSGGAPLAPEIAKTFIGLGLTISQGYGLTETSPIVSTNKLDNNEPFSVGQTMGGVDVKLGDNDELLVKGPTVMQGYWNNESATKDVIDKDGWFHTGDIAKIENNHIYITGRIKEIIVLANGEKVPPSDIELAINSDSLFEQVIIIGEAKPFLAAIVTIEYANWEQFAKQNGIATDESSLNLAKTNEIILKRINDQLSEFPGYAKIIRSHVVLKPWDIESGLITPTLKLKRSKIFEKYENEIKEMYRGH
ncbi:MAG: long-chain fatty acid--CoA ligase [Gammaproteobacteria bacterium]|nr:long-chain fatty acid--CoA ligase [Gammaproteobacteria bacterium]